MLCSREKHPTYNQGHSSNSMMHPQRGRTVSISYIKVGPLSGESSPTLRCTKRQIRVKDRVIGWRGGCPYPTSKQVCKPGLVKEANSTLLSSSNTQNDVSSQQYSSVLCGISRAPQPYGVWLWGGEHSSLSLVDPLGDLCTGKFEHLEVFLMDTSLYS